MKTHKVIHIVSNRYGTVPKYLYRGTYPPKGLEFLKNLENISITEAECRAAAALKIPCISLVDSNLTNQRNVELVQFQKSAKNVKSVVEYQIETFCEVAITEISKITPEKRKLTKKSESQIIGRKLLLDQAANSVFHS